MPAAKSKNMPNICVGPCHGVASQIVRSRDILLIFVIKRCVGLIFQFAKMVRLNMLSPGQSRVRKTEIIVNLIKFQGLIGIGSYLFPVFSLDY